MKATIKIWVDSSYYCQSNNCSWGAVFTNPHNQERIKLSGTFHGIKSSTHAEIAGVYEVLRIVSEMLPGDLFDVRLDCKSIVDLYEYPRDHKTKDLAIGRVLRKLRTEFGEIATLSFVPGHTNFKDKSENSVRNREAHNLAYWLNKKGKAS